MCMKGTKYQVKVDSTLPVAFIEDMDLGLTTAL